MIEKKTHKKVRTRYAPSPTGIPHVGNIRTALFSYFFSRANNGIFILRIEDTDQARKVEGAVEAIQESLKWLGIDWDEYIVQSQRLSEYKKHADDLLSRGLAKHEDGAIRFLIPRDSITSWKDKVGNKKIEFKNSDVEDFIILKKDGFPTYHFANIVDDHASGITHVIRGEEWIPSTPKHILLYKAFGWEIPEFAHVPNVNGTDGKKLSKRHGAKSVLNFKDEGILSSALLNYLMLLGWSPKNDHEILSKDEIIKEFALDKINSSPAIFDINKLLWMNGVYIRQTKDSQLESQIYKFYNEKYSEEIIKKTTPLIKERIKKISDYLPLCEFFFKVPSDYEVDLSSKKEIVKKIVEALSVLDNWKAQLIGDCMQSLAKNLNIKNSEFFMILRVALTGKKISPPLNESMEILDKDKTIERLNKVIS